MEDSTESPTQAGSARAFSLEQGRFPHTGDTQAGLEFQGQEMGKVTSIEGSDGGWACGVLGLGPAMTHPLHSLL